MTNELAVMLIGPVGALIAATLLGGFVMFRINRYGRVFNWPPIPEKSGPPRIKRHEK